MPRDKTIKSFPSAVRRVQLPRERLRSFAKRLHSLHRVPSSPPPAVDSINVVCISDTHGLQPPIPPGDLLLHAGDLTQWGTFNEIQAQLTWLSRQPHKYKVVIDGNHDLFLDEDFRQQHPERWKQALDAAAVGNSNKEVDIKTAKDLDWGDIIYLQDSSAALPFPSHSRTINIFGSPLTPRHGLSSFHYNRGTDVWTGSVPANTDILLTHGPPWGHLDSIRDGVKKSGCAFLAKELSRVQPRLVVYGHIHVGYGQEEQVYDSVGRAYEAIIGGWGGWKDLTLMAWSLWLHWLLPQKWERAHQRTTFVNAAVVEGFEEYKVKNEAAAVSI
ncbi:MAG: hypothetical protein Q9191_000770 [Dirinaria sp. TL-2023a]